MEQIKTIDDVNHWIEESKKGPLLFYKHSFRCSICGEAKEEIEVFDKENPDISIVWIDVVEDREASNHLADVSGIVHKSPQTILYNEGSPSWNTSHREITLATLKQNIL